jgi:hypothetical protein
MAAEACIEGVGAGEGEEMERAGELAAKRRRKEELFPAVPRMCSEI